MNLLIFGATGHLGRPLLQQALAADHTVTVLLRHPEDLGANHERLRLVQGDALNAEEVAAHMTGHHAVLSTLGPRRMGGSFDILSEGTQNIVSAMNKAGIRRLIAVAAAGILPVAGSTLVRDQPFFPPTLRDISAAHLHVHEALCQSDLDWTLLCPPRVNQGPLTGHYRVLAEQALEGGQEISAQDTAHFILSELAQQRHVRSRVAIAY